MTLGDCLKTLGLPEGGVTLKQLKSAFRKKAIETHPDKGGNTEDFIEVKKAYDAIVSAGPQQVPVESKPMPKPVYNQPCGSYYKVHSGFAHIKWDIHNINVA